MNRLTKTVPAILIIVSVIGAASHTASADAGDAALGVFGGLLLGEILGQGRQQPAPQGQTVYLPQQPPAPAYREPQPALEIPVEQRLGKLQELRDKGLITDAEYTAARQEILNNL